MKLSGTRPRTASGTLTCMVAMALTMAASMAEPANVPDLKKSPMVQRLWLGMEQGVIRPASYEQLMSDIDQRVIIHVADGTELKKGQHWATLGPLNLEFERRAHALDKVKAERDLAKELAALEDERIKMVVAQQEAMANLEALRLAATDSTLPPELRQRSEKAADKLAEKIDLMDKQLEPAAMEQDRELIRKDAALKQERRDKQLEEVERRSRIVAGNDGALALSEDVVQALKEKGEEEFIWVKSNKLIGVVRNDEHHELWVNAQGPLLADLPPDRLSVNIHHARTGAMIPATHLRTEEVESGAEIKRTYVFRVGDDNADKASDAVGVRSMVHVYVNFEKKYRRVFKKDIAHIDPERLETAGWAGLVHQLWPGSKVVQVGPQTIAVQAPDEN